MRVAKNAKADSEKAVTLKTSKNINWPDLMFGPVNLWTLPPASFFYRKLN